MNKPRWNAGQAGDPDGNRAERDNVYGRMFGSEPLVVHENGQADPHVDVFIYQPDARRPFFTFITGGMSDRRMKVPSELGHKAARTELVFYGSESRVEFANMLRVLAQYPHRDATWFGTGHTIESPGLLDIDGQGKGYRGFLMMTPPHGPDADLSQLIEIHGDPVNLLWVIPLTERELRLAQAKGVDELLRILFKHRHLYVFDPKRKSYV